MEEVKKKDILLNLADLDDTARVCRALSSETRLEILKCLIDRAMTISELAEKFYLPMSSMCLHIKTLREANNQRRTKTGHTRFPEALRHENHLRHPGPVRPCQQAHGEAAGLYLYAHRPLFQL